MVRTRRIRTAIAALLVLGGASTASAQQWNITITPGQGVVPAQPGTMPQVQPSMPTPPAPPAPPTIPQQWQQPQQPQWQPPQQPQWQPPPAPPVPPQAPVMAPNGRPGRTQTLTGSLRRSRQQGPTGGFVRQHRVSLRAGDNVTVTMTSTAFDTYVVVKSPQRAQLAENDDVAPQVLDSRVSFVAPANGRYTIEATSYAPNVTGGYQLTIDINQAATAIQTPSNPQVPTPNQPWVPPTAGNGVAGRNGQGRILGVFVGIDDYMSNNDLQGCAADAQRMAAAFASIGMRQQDAMVLTDHQATIANVTQAIRQVGARASQSDVFVFFYSGHGGQVTEIRRGNESDGMDETIVLQDGSIRDDEMDQLFDSINTDTQVFALDSCHSGGFARDMDSARRVGLYSSEEGVLSDTAPRYGAGGFLSHWMRVGVEGQAAGPNGSTRVGDLINYLHRQFADHRAEMQTTADGFPTDQRLVVTRGAAMADHLWTGRPAGAPMVATR